ncbi:poly(A)-binding protein binding protein [Microbotryomycetes sp. JL221]|nr:poly(A)-binding protein binding protein [Microbotryomycetes sp. JL221]
MAARGRKSWSSSSRGGAPAQERLTCLLGALVGQHVTVTLRNNDRLVKGIVGAAPSADGHLSVVLRQAVHLPNSNLGAPNSVNTHGDGQKLDVVSSMTVHGRDIIAIEAADVSLTGGGLGSTGAGTNRGDTFKTDTQLSGRTSLKQRERQLQAWGVGPDSGTALGAAPGGGLSLEDESSSLGGNSSRGWDQFAANERLHGVRSDYDEELYTTKLDRTAADYKQREQRAAQLEKEILRATGTALAGNVHMAEERNMIDEGQMNEEDRYGAVIRGPNAYVPPAARKAVSTSTSPANVPSAADETIVSGERTTASMTVDSSNAANAAAAADPSIISINSRLPIPASGTSRIPSTSAAAAAAAAAGSERAEKSTVPSVDSSFRQFVSSERQRLTEKKQAMAKAAARQDKDTKLASLLAFSQNFKLPVPTPPDIAEIAGHGPAKLAAQDGPSVGETSRSAALAQTQSRQTMQNTSTGQTTATTASNDKSSNAWSKSKFNLEIPPFNPNRTPNKVGESQTPVSDAAPSKSASPAATTSPSATAPPSAPLVPKPPSSGTKISANAPAFVFKPNPTASSFTPGASLVRKPTVAAATPPAAPSNPFFGTKPINKGSLSMHVKEEFTPYKTANVPEASSIAPAWSFTGKPYRSLYPPSPTPPPPTSLPQSVAGADDESQAAVVFGSTQSHGPSSAGVSPPGHPLPQAFGVFHPPHQFQPPPPPPSQFGRLAPPGPQTIPNLQNMSGMTNGTAMQFQQYVQPVGFAQQPHPYGGVQQPQPQHHPQQPMAPPQAHFLHGRPY